MNRSAYLDWLLCVCLAVLASLGGVTPASAQAQWEDYQGTATILGTSNQDKPGPNYNNNSGTFAGNIGALRTLAATPANATRTGTSALLDYGPNDFAFCNTSNSAAGTSYDAAGTAAACQADAQGRVTYALIKFPAAGNYTFESAHDDEIDLDLSSDYTNTSYRTASYNLPVGTASSFTAETVFETLGTVNSAVPNSCILLRLYWNNAGGLHFMHLRWDTPSAANQAIPAAQIFNPGVAASSAGCAGAVTGTATSLVVNKIIGATGRTAAADQFTVGILVNASGAVVGTASTGGAGTGQQASTGAALINNGVTYRVTDAMAAGSASTLASYVSTIACTRAGTAFTPGGTAPNWTVATTALNQQIICDVTNARGTATLQLQKTWVNAVVGNTVLLPATTGFASNTTVLSSIANTANETDAGTSISILTGETGTLAAESFSTGTASAYGSVISCSGGTLSGSNGQTSNTLNTGSIAAGAAIVCTYTNTWRPPLTIAKSSAPFSDPINGLTNPKLIPGGFVTYTLLVSSPSAYAVDSNTVSVIDALPINTKLFVGDYGGAGSGPVSFVDGAPVSGLAYSYTALNSVADNVDFSSDGGVTWGYSPTANASGVDTSVTHIRIRPQGGMSASRNFTLRFRCQIQ